VTTASTTTVAPATTRSLDDYGEEYLRIIKPANDALDEWTRKAKAYTDDTTADEIATDTEPVAAAIEEADNELLRADWPQDVSPDVKAFVTANGALIGDFRSVGSQTIFTVSDWVTQLSKDAGTSHSAASIVRADLGLPPASS
jgi:hypothetical protein